jgi:ATP-binding cassette, subfamily B, bacterial
MNVLKSARFLLALGVRLDPRRLVVATVLMVISYVAAPLSALALAGFVDDLIDHHAHNAEVLAVVLAVLLVSQAMGHHFSHLCYARVAEEQLAHLSVELIDTMSAPPGIEHLDDPRFADDMELLRNQLFVVTRALESLLELAALLLQLAISIGILVSVDPWLALLPLFAVPPLFLGEHAQTLLEAAREQCAAGVRLNRHLLELATTPSTASELRLFGAEGEILRRQESVWEEITRTMVRGQARSATRRALGQLIFTVGYAGAVLVVVSEALRGHASIGELILVITLAIQVNVQLAGAVSQLTGLQTAGRAVERLERIRRDSDKRTASTAVSPLRRRQLPERLQRGIVLDKVSFSYPGRPELVLDNISLEMPAGSTVALVGENGAGKSTLVKLLCGLYAPGGGRILVDGVDLADFLPAEWRSRVAALFQDYFRFEFVMGEAIGLGEVALIDDAAAIRRAVAHARAERVVSAVPGGLDGVVGRNYKAGAELSGGQWQILALARCFMRELPLLLVLDEPASGLDANAEHALFERYASSAKVVAREVGGVTVLISHRFSTVLMADTIAVLDGGSLVESGSHRELMSNNGLYAELFRLQARAYG